MLKIKIKSKRFLLLLCTIISISVLSVVSKAVDRNTSWFSSKFKTVPDFTILIAIHWEGEKIQPASLKALKNIRNNLKGVRFVHLLNAAYFTRAKGSVERERIAKEIRSVVSEKDYLGIHLNPYRSLVEAAGVDFKSQPTFWGNKLPESQCKVDCGHEVSLNAYNSNEIYQLLQKSIATLNEVGFDELQFFHAGGWLQNNSSKEIIEDLGFTFSLNRVYVDNLNDALGEYPIYQWLTGLNANKAIGRSHLTSSGLTHIQNFLGYVSYHSRKDLIAHFKEFIKESLEATPIWTLSVSQETAHTDSLILTQAVWDILAYARKFELRSSFFELHPSSRKGNQKLSSLTTGEPKPNAPIIESELQNDKNAGGLGKMARDFYSKMLQYSQ